MNIINTLDTFIVNRLKLMELDAKSLPVLPYEPSRERGKNEYPFASVTRIGFFEEKDRRRYGIEVFRPSDKKKVVLLSNGNARVIPDHYEVRSYPGIYTFRYIIDTEAVREDHAAMLIILMKQVFPFGYEPYVAGQPLLFRFTEPIYKDDLSRPLFKVSYMFDVSGVRIDSFGKYTVGPMSKQLFDVSHENNIIESAPWDGPDSTKFTENIN